MRYEHYSELCKVVRVGIDVTRKVRGGYTPDVRSTKAVEKTIRAEGQFDNKMCHSLGYTLRT